MMDDLRDLYEEVILDHNRHPRNYPKRPPGCNHSAKGDNPLCGDQVEVHLTLSDGVVVDVGFEGEGCAISTASASLMTEAIKGRTVAEIETLFTGVHDLVAGNADPLDAQERVGKLAVLAGVREYPMRVKCATLPWHTLHAALRGEEHPVSTE